MRGGSRYCFRLMAVVSCLFFVYFISVNKLKNNLLTRGENSIISRSLANSPFETIQTDLMALRYLSVLFAVSTVTAVASI